MKFKLILQDGVYTGMLNGHIFMSDTLTTEQVKVLVGTPTEDEIIEIFNPKMAEVKENNKQLQELQDVLTASGLFEEKKGSYYRVGNPISVPKMLLEKYKNLLQADDGMKVTPELEALDNFWLKCSLNPNLYARENLFEYLQRWEFVITSKGYIVSYRNANIFQQGNKELHDFIATNYTRIKGQKKSPKNYDVYRDFDNTTYFIKTDKYKSDYDSENPDRFVGNLQDLYNNLSELSETVYTDAHSGTTRIRIGEVVSIGMKNCNQSQVECEAGLHTASSKWLKKNYYGSVGVVCLVNPMEIASVPKGDYGKMRSASYLPIGLTEYDDSGKIIPISTDFYEDDYDVYTLEELNRLLQEIDPSNQVIHKLEFQELSNQVYTSMDEYRKVLESKTIRVWDSFDEEE